MIFADFSGTESNGREIDSRREARQLQIGAARRESKVDEHWVNRLLPLTAEHPVRQLPLDFSKNNDLIEGRRWV
jgi:hypothetical protein